MRTHEIFTRRMGQKRTGSIIVIKSFCELYIYIYIYIYIYKTQGGPIKICSKEVGRQWPPSRVPHAAGDDFQYM